MSRSDLPNVKSGSSTTLNYPESGKDDTREKTLSGEESSPSNSVQPTKGEDPKQIALSHPKLVAALSRSPYSPLFGILWPIIIEQASFDTRDILRDVDPYFEKLCRPHRDSDLAKQVRCMPFQNFTVSNSLSKSFISRITEILSEEKDSHMFLIWALVSNGDAGGLTSKFWVASCREFKSPSIHFFNKTKVWLQQPWGLSYILRSWGYWSWSRAQLGAICF